MEFQTAPRIDLIDGGHAYQQRDGFPYVAPVHTRLFGEYPSGHADIQHRLTAECWQHGTYLGAGGLVNLGYIAVLEPRTIELFDVNGLQEHYWRRLIPFILARSAVADFWNDLPQFHRDWTAWATTVKGDCPTNHIRGERDEPVIRLLQRSPDVYGLGARTYPRLHAALTQARFTARTADVRDAPLWRQIEYGLPDRGPRVVYTANIFAFTQDATDYAHFPSGYLGHQAGVEAMRRLAFPLLAAPSGLISLLGMSGNPTFSLTSRDLSFDLAAFAAKPPEPVRPPDVVDNAPRPARVRSHG